MRVRAAAAPSADRALRDEDVRGTWRHPDNKGSHLELTIQGERLSATRVHDPQHEMDMPDDGVSRWVLFEATRSGSTFSGVMKGGWQRGAVR